LKVSFPCLTVLLHPPECNSKTSIQDFCRSCNLKKHLWHSVLPPRPDAKIKSVCVNDVWCIDIVFDVTTNGTTVKFLTIVDEYSHYCLDIAASWRSDERFI